MDACREVSFDPMHEFLDGSGAADSIECRAESLAPPTRDRRGRRAFTFLEVLMVLTVIALLVMLILPAVQMAREAARRHQCRNNLMQIGMALRNYEAAHLCLPPGSVDPNRPIVNNTQGYHFGWVVQILPQLDQPILYANFDPSVSVYHKSNILLLRNLPVFSCPTNRTGASYAACHHDVESPIDIDNNGVLFLNSSIRREDILDGAASTLFIGEAAAGGALIGQGWSSGTRTTLRNTGSPINGSGGRAGAAAVTGPPAVVNLLAVGGFGSSHSNGANFAFGDGSVQFLDQSISMSIFKQLGNRADGELPAGEF